MAYPHEALVKAWLDGQKIQFKDPVKDIWIDIEGPDKADKMPHFYREGTEYRVKPVSVRYRVGIKRGGSLFVVSSLTDAKLFENSSDFGQWINDWHEVEV